MKLPEIFMGQSCPPRAPHFQGDSLPRLSGVKARFHLNTCQYSVSQARRKYLRQGLHMSHGALYMSRMSSNETTGCKRLIACLQNSSRALDISDLAHGKPNDCCF